MERIVLTWSNLQPLLNEKTTKITKIRPSCKPYKTEVTKLQALYNFFFYMACKEGKKVLYGLHGGRLSLQFL